MFIRCLLIVTGIMLIMTSVNASLNADLAYAEGPYKYHKFPGPWEYEEDMVTVACAQIQPVYGDVPATLEKIKDYTTRAAEKGAQIIVFPEVVLNACMLGDTVCAANRATELIPGPSSLEIAKLTEKYGVYVVYGFYEHDASDPKVLYNTAAIIGPEGIIGSYRKMHPTRIEKVIRGREPVTFNTKWGPIGVGICFDNYQYPELARTYGIKGCRLILSPTAITFGGDQDQVMLEALNCRSVENFMFIASANRVKARALIEPGAEYGGLIDAGQSVILGPISMSYKPGYYAGPASKTDDELLIATLDLSLSDGLRTLGSNFTINPMQGEPDFMPETWAKLWGTPATPPVNEELEAANRELANLRADYAEVSRTDQRTTTLLSIATGVLLLSTIGLGAVILRKRRNK